MSLNSALNTALSGINLNARLADIVSLNVANAATDGYGVRRANVASLAYSGATVTHIERHQNAALLQSRREAGAARDSEDFTSRTLSGIEAAFGEVGDDASISTHLARLDTALIEASSAPFSEPNLAQVGSRFESLVTRINQASDSLRSMRESADAQIGTLVSELSSDLKTLEKLDRNLMAARGDNKAQNTLLDQKQVIIDRISAIVPIREITDARLGTTLQTSEGFVLYARGAPELEFSQTPIIQADMTLASGALGAVKLNGQPLDNGFGKLKGGLLEAAFDARDIKIVSAQAKLDNFAFDLATQFSEKDGSVTIGDLGVLTDNGQALDPQNITGFAERMSVNQAAVDTNKFRTGFGSGPISQGGGQLHDWSDTLGTRSTLSASGLTSDLTRLASMLSESATQDRVLQEEKLTFSTSFVEALKTQELEEGVDTDQELQSLLRIEKAYAANARMIQTIDAMMQSLLEI